MAAPPPPHERLLQLGFRFKPTPQEAVTYLNAGEPVHPSVRPYIHDADVYACEPGVLAAQFHATPRGGDRFFFTTCKRQPRPQPKAMGKASRVVRAAGSGGSWRQQGDATDIEDGAGVKVGEVRRLRYRNKGGAFTDWLMDEFSSCSEEDAAVGGGDRQRVLCKMYVSPRAGPHSTARREAVAPPVPQETVVAPPVVEQQRCAVVQTPQMVQPPLCFSSPPWGLAAV